MIRRSMLLITLASGCSAERMLDPLDPSSFPQYSGTATIEAGPQKSVFDYYRDGKKLRIVPNTPAGSTSASTMALIVDEEAKTTTAISAATKRYVVHGIAQKNAPSGSGWPLGLKGKSQKIVSREDIGTERINDYSCTIQRIVMVSDDGKEHTLKLWSSKELKGFAVKIQTSDSKTPLSVTFSNIKLGPVGDVSLFTIPADFKNAAGG